MGDDVSSRANKDKRIVGNGAWFSGDVPIEDSVVVAFFSRFRISNGDGTLQTFGGSSGPPR